MSANLDAVRMMRTVNPRCVVVLNYAPATEISLELIEEVDCVVVNESEARAISEAYEILDEPTRASDRPQRNRAIVYTMGAAGARLVMTRDLTFREAFVRDGDGNSQDEARVEAMRFGDDETVIDTVGAGDAFVGAFCAAMASDATCADALRLASAAGGLTCLSSGARADVSRARASERFPSRASFEVRSRMKTSSARPFARCFSTMRCNNDDCPLPARTGARTGA